MTQPVVKNIEAIHALTPMQAGMLFHSRLHPESSLYFAQVRCDLAGPLSLERFEHAFRAVVARHPALRTCFVWQGLDEPRQVVRREVELPFEIHDWRESSDERFETDLADWLAADQRRGFALDRAPLMRLALFRRGDESWHLVWSNHHLILDGWSIPRVMGDVLVAYERGASALPPAPRSFGDFVAWLGRQDLALAEAHWRQVLRGVRAATPLGIGRGVPAREGASEAGREHGEWRVDLPADEFVALERLAAQERLTLNTLVQGAWALLLARYNGTRDVIYGMTVAGRPPELRGVEEMVGLFINSLPMRIAVEPETSSVEWLHRLQDAQLEARRFEHTPLVEIQGWSEVPTGAPLFESLVIFESYPLTTGTGTPGEIRITKTEASVFSNYPLAILAVPTPGGLRFHLKFDRAVLDDDHAAQIVDHLRQVLARWVRDPRLRLGDVDLLVASHADRLPDPRVALVPEDPPPPSERIRQWARQTPEAAALAWQDVGGTRLLSYRELDEAIDNLANALVHRGGVPGERVVITGKRSPGRVVAMAAVLRVGGALVNLDGTLPEARRRLMVDRSGASLAILVAPEESATTADPPELAGLVVIRVDSEGRIVESAALPSADALPPLAPDGPAYVFFTSGTTGEPKPVLGKRRGLAHFLAWQSARFEIGPGDRGAQLTGPAFDVVLRDVFLPLVSGATLHLPPDDPDASRPDVLLPWLATQRATFLHLVPSVARAWLATNVEVDLSALRFVFFAGEPLADTVIRDFRERFAPAATIVNLYGPTETTLAKCCGVLAPGEAPEPGIQNVGRALPGAQALLLRRDATEPRLAGLGEVGEIVLRTPYRSLGYLGTDPHGGRFFPNPWRDDPEDWLYRTGDLGRRWPDGRLAILGRVDDQVKVRGTRVEPAEVAAVCGNHPAVAAVFVAGRRDEDGETELVAWVEPRDTAVGFEPAGELRRWLAERLPAAYVPSRFVLVKPMPLTANGKVDRAALPDPAAAPAALGAAGAQPPRTATEELMIDLWTQILGRPVDGGSHFFDAGGHSLHATRLASRLRTTFGVELPLRTLFESPTVRGLAAAVDAARAAGDGLPPLEPPRPMPRHPQGEVLSSAQRRLWFLQALDPEGVAYNLPTALRLVGTLDVEALRGTFERLVARHESLRTRFVAPVEDDEPRQKVLPAVPVEIPLVDLSEPLLVGLTGLAPQDRSEALAEHLRREAQTPFDLAVGPLLRLRLLRLDVAEHVLIVTLHHIVSDGWSVGVLVREVATLYGALAAGEEPRLAPLPIQYPDFAIWQRSNLEGERLASLLAWWRERLAEEPAVLELPTDRPRPPVASGRGLRVQTVIPRELADGIRALARKEAATPFMVLLAAYATLLARYSGQDAFAIGTPVANRGSSEVEGLIGFFVNTLVMPVAPHPRRTFRDLLGEIKATALGAYAHQDMPFDRLVEELAPRRRLDRTPLFQVMLVLQNAPLGEFRLPGLELELLDARTGGTKFDLDLILRDAGDLGLAVTLELAADLYDEATGRRLLDHFATLLADIVADPARSLLAFDLLPASERRAIAAAAGPPALASEPPFQGFFEHFVAQAERTPEALCLVDEEAALSFAATRARAEQLAGWLQAHGIGREDRVVLLLERSAAAIVGLLGILAAGAAYVPIDPRYPHERRRLMFEDAGPRAVVTRRSHATGAAGQLPAGCVLLAVEDLPPAPALSFRAPRTEPDQAAYVIYTSGSTGRPKGVVVHHRHLLAYLFASKSRLGFEPGMVYALVQPLGFDSAVTAVHPPLLFGGTILLVGEEAALDPALLAECFAGQRPDCLKISPAHLAALLAADRPHEVLPTRLLVVGGEALRPDLVARVRELAPEVAIHNEYGPTETTVGIVTQRVEKIEGATSVPIGRALPGATARVLDESMQPVPFGVPGELYLGGPAVTRGYLGRPAATAARFVPDPFVGPGGRGGERLYRTGDRARLRPDGDLEFLGRVDGQVKIRGHRVELGEIEAALGALPAVVEAAVVTRGTGGAENGGELSLVGYVVPRAGAELAEADLRRELATRLPEYLVPSRLVVLAALPRNRHGKLDREALPAPPNPAHATDVAGAPRTPTEKLLAALWRQLLGVEAVTRDDDFFALGGHSLLATRLATRVRTELGIELPVRAVFEAPRLAALAARIDEITAGPRASLPPLRRRAGGSESPLSFAQERLWFLDRLEPGSPAYNVGGAISLEGELDGEFLARALAMITDRHEVLRTAFRERDGRPFQQVEAPQLDFAQVDLRDPATPDEEPRDALRATLRKQVLEPFDLAAGHLFRVRLLRVSESRHVLSFVLHHIVSDAWSQSVLVRELGAIYRALAKGETPRLPALPVQYADFAAWQRGWLTDDEALAPQLGYWQQQLAGLAGSLDLPTDRPRPALLSARGAAVSLALTDAESAAIRRLGRDLGATPFMTLLAAFQVLLARWSGQQDIAVGTPVAGRRQAELEPLVGCFINTLVLRTIVDPKEPLSTLVARVRESVLDAFSHQDLPFERLVEVLQPTRSLDHTPLFQVMFVFSNVERQDLVLPGLETRPAIAEDLTATTKFDLTLFAEELPPSDGRGAGHLELRLQYSTDLFDEVTMVRFLGHYRQLLAAATAEPTTAVGQLELMAPAELRLVTPCAEPLPAPVATTIHGWVRRRAEHSPAAIALDAVDEPGGPRRRWTYAELVATAGRWARDLRAQGVTAETPVAVCLERTGALPLALLAVMESGGAYVPLDPAYPTERLLQTLEDSGATLLITSQSLWTGGRLAELAVRTAGHVRTVFVDQPPFSEVGGATEEPEPVSAVVDPEQIAYWIYTSGSTGRPKGVAICHRNAVARIAWATQAESAPWLQCVLASTSVCFDLSVYELFVPWCHGGTVVLVDNALGLAGLAPETGVTLINTVPSAMAELLRQAAVPPSVRVVNLAGEPLQGRLVDALYALDGVQAVYNLYGPSEDTTYSTFVGVPRERSGEPTIGRPLPGTRAAVVDHEGRLVPVGIPGELLLGGVGVSRGYRGRPAQTAERWVPDPWSEQPGARLYRTGDLAKWLASGELAFLGRLDHQVKIRGFRVELGEIEERLRQLPGVAEAVVVARFERVGAFLVAYVVPSVGTAPADLGDRCAADLRRQLPEHMVPSSFVPLDRLPLTPNGKVDRKALPHPTLGPRSAGFVAPRTATEALVSEIWREVLGVEAVGIHDDFFTLGGHSLSAARVVAQLRQAFGLGETELPVRVLFEAATVEALAARIEGGPAGSIPVIDLWAEIGLPEDIRPAPERVDPSAPWRTILVTGATGFVGAHLLAEILTRTSARVRCLVRARDRASGSARLRRALTERGLWQDAWCARIEPLLGDLAEPRLGLSAADWQRTAFESDVIFHAGSWVNVTYPYGVLRAANVFGAREILRLAAEGRAKPLHLLSTLSVFFDRTGDRPGVRIAENDPLEHADGPASGYAQSKWVAEKLAQEARRRGLSVTVHRFGRVGWHRETGDWNSEDVLFHVLGGCLLLGRAPAVDLPVDVIAVDELVAAIVALASKPGAEGACHHYLPAKIERWPRLVEWLAELGLDVSAVPLDEWLAELRRQASAGDALMKLLALTAEPPAMNAAGAPQAPTDTREQPGRFANEATAAALHRAGASFSALDLELFRPVVEWLTQRLGIARLALPADTARAEEDP